MQTRDALAYIGEVAKWLESCPEGTRDYGEFYVSEVKVVFEGEHIGTFKSDDPDWIFYDANET